MDNLVKYVQTLGVGDGGWIYLRIFSNLGVGVVNSCGVTFESKKLKSRIHKKCTIRF